MEDEGAGCSEDGIPITCQLCDQEKRCGIATSGQFCCLSCGEKHGLDVIFAGQFYCEVSPPPFGAEIVWGDDA